MRSRFPRGTVALARSCRVLTFALLLLEDATRVSVSVRWSAQYVAGFRRTRITTVDDRATFDVVLHKIWTTAARIITFVCQSGFASRPMCRSGWANLVLFPKIVTSRLRAMIGRA